MMSIGFLLISTSPMFENSMQPIGLGIVIILFSAYSIWKSKNK